MTNQTATVWVTIIVTIITVIFWGAVFYGIALLANSCEKVETVEEPIDYRLP